MTTRRHPEETIDSEAEGRVDALIERGMEVFEGQKEHAEQALVYARRYIRKNPGQSLLIAVGVGFVLGALWSRRS